MNFNKCLFYGIVIAILIIILINLVKSVKENFDELQEPKEVLVEEKPLEEKPLEEKVEDIKEDKGLLSSFVDKVKDVAETVKDKIVGDDEQQPQPIPNIKETEEQPASLNTEGQQEQLNILPKFVDKVSSTVEDGVKLIKQPVETAWSDVYLNENNDLSFMLPLGDDPKKNYGSMRFVDRSPVCCAPTYPIPFKIKVDKEIMDHAGDYVPSIYFGNNNGWENHGCACVRKEDAISLFTRGGNGGKA